MGDELPMVEAVPGPLGVAEVPHGQPTGAGWEIGVFGAAPEIRRLEDNMLSQTH